MSSNLAKYVPVQTLPAPWKSRSLRCSRYLVVAFAIVACNSEPRPALDVGNVSVALGDSTQRVLRELRARYEVDSGDTEFLRRTLPQQMPSGGDAKVRRRDWYVLDSIRSLGGFSERDGVVVSVRRSYEVDAAVGLVDRYTEAINEMKRLLNKHDLAGCDTKHEMGLDRSLHLTLYKYVVTTCGQYEVSVGLPHGELPSKFLGGAHVELRIVLAK